MTCERCGRCCTYADRCLIVPELTADDLAVLTPEERLLFAVELNGRWGIRARLVAHRAVCCALEFANDGKAICVLHERKPTECREWQSDCALCRHYRSLPDRCFWRNA